MTEHDCNPAEFVRWSEIKPHCDEKHGSDKLWANEIINSSLEDRKALRERIAEVEKILYGTQDRDGLLTNLAKLSEAFSPVRMIVYGGVSMALMSVAGAVIALVLRK